MTRLVKLCLVTGLVCVAAVGSRAQGTPTVFINEIHYDNTGTDAGEFIEVAGPAGTDLSQYSIVLYNGAAASRSTYNTVPLAGVIPNQAGGFGTASVLIPGIQNGSPDGMALIFSTTTVVQFLSYDGVFVAANGPASGMTSTNIGVTQSGGAPLGQSLGLAGTGTGYSDFAWGSGAQSPGAVNAGQDFSGTAGATVAIDNVSVTEGNSGTTTATFTVTVTGAHTGVTFDIATSDGISSAPATLADNDYVENVQFGRTIAQGSTYSFTVTVNGDVAYESDEEFIVSLSNVTGATVVDGLATGTIVNDDAAPPATSDVVISQIYGGGGNSGATYTHDFIELFNRGAASVNLSGWSVQYVSATGTGTWSVTPLSGSLAPGSYYLVQQAAGAAGTTPLPAPNAIGTIAMAAGAGKVAVRPSLTAFAGACPGAGLAADFVGYGGASCFEGSSPTAAISATVAALRKRGGCVDSNNNGVDFSTNSPAPRNSASPLNSCTFTTAAIHEIQGDAFATPLAGQDVSTTGIVTALKSNGFFIQTRDDADGNPATSQGLFVFTSMSPNVAVGDSVTARGTATEFFALTQLESSLPGDVTVDSTGNPLPAALTLTTGLLDPAGGIALEHLEGMRVHADALTSVAPTNEFGEIAAVLAGVARPMREPGIEISLTVPPDPTSGTADCCIPRWDENPERILVDSDGLAGSTPILVTSNVGLGNVTGPLDYSFGAYKVVPEAPPATTGNISVTPLPVPAANELTVAGSNIIFFSNNETQRRKAALAIRQVLHYPDVIGLIEILDQTSLQALTDQVNADAALAGDPAPGYVAYLIPAPTTTTQNLGFIIKTSRVQGTTVTQEQASLSYTNPLNGNQELLHDRPPLVLRATVTPSGQGPRPFIVVLNHLRSFIDIELVGGDGLRVRAKRTAQAEATASLLQSLQTDNPGQPVISIGDYNAYQFNDGFTDPISIITGSPTPDDQVVVDESPELVTPNFVNLTDSLPADQRYSFIFEGTPQAIDHIIVNRVAAALVQRYAIAHNNADFPEGTTFSADVTRPERYSDHDVPMAYFAFPPLADLSVTAAGPVAAVTTGGAFSYSVSVANNGPDAASNVTLSIAAQVGLQFSAVTAPAGWRCATPAPGTTGAVSCTAASLAVGVSDAIMVTAFVDCGLGDGALVSQAISVASAETDSAQSDNTTLVTITAANPPPTIAGVVPPITLSPVPGAAKAGAVVANAALGTPIAIDNCGAATVTRSGVPVGNLFPVGTTTVTYTATDSGGGIATATTTVKVLNAVESLQVITGNLEAVIAGSTTQALTRRATAALLAIQRAIAQLGEVPSDHSRAVTYITAAVGELEDILKKNLLNATVTRDVLKRLVGVSWLLAKQDLELALSQEGQNLSNLIAGLLLNEANNVAAAGRYSQASGIYWLVIGFARD